MDAGLSAKDARRHLKPCISEEFLGSRRIYSDHIRARLDDLAEIFTDFSRYCLVPGKVVKVRLVSCIIYDETPSILVEVQTANDVHRFDFEYENALYIVDDIMSKCDDPERISRYKRMKIEADLGL